MIIVMTKERTKEFKAVDLFLQEERTFGAVLYFDKLRSTLVPVFQDVQCTN